MAEKLEYGIKNVHYAPITISENGTVTFGAPIAFPGASEISLSTVGDALEVFADNVTYVKMGVNQGYDGNLNVYKIPNDFYENHLGMIFDDNGVMIESSSATTKDFALMYEFNTDTAKTKRTVLYNVSASRPEISGKTKENSISVDPFSIPIVAASATDTEYVKASVVGDSSDAAWSSWFSSVYTSAETAQHKVTLSVTDGTDPIADALVACGGKIGMTDSTGFAYFMLPDGTYDVLISATGYTAQASTVTVASAAVTKSITMVAV